MGERRHELARGSWKPLAGYARDDAKLIAGVREILKRYNDAAGGVGSTDALQEIALLLNTN